MKIICGIDEAGRGALAGPIVAAAVILNKENLQKIIKSPLKFRDSKLLTKRSREKIFKYLIKNKIPFQTEVISARRINNRGIGRANRECIKELVRKISADEYIIDGKLKLGRIKGKTNKIICVIDADATILSVILAGIVAKVTRDKLMSELHQSFSKYNWDTNCGYGTKFHIKAILKYGTTPNHRNIYVASALRHYAKTAE